MKYNKLSNTGLDVSAICLGTMNFGQQCDEKNSHEQLDYATANGVNFIDTAEMYPVPPEKALQGLTETYIGNWLSSRKKRNDIIIASKVSGRNQAGLMGRRDATAGLTKQNILAAIDGTLSRLQTDHIDLYQVHTPDRHTNFFGRRGVVDLDNDDGVSIEETLDGLNDVLKSGKVRFVGVSNESPWGIMEYLRIAKEKNYPRIVSIQNNYSLLARGFEVGLSEMCLRENIGLLSYSTLNRGVIAGKYLDGAKPEGARFTRWNRDVDRYNPSHAEPAVRAYIALAKKYNLDVSQMAYAWGVARPFMAAVIIGATSIAQLKSDIEAADIDLPAELYADIEKIYTEMPDPTC